MSSSKKSSNRRIPVVGVLVVLSLAVCFGCFVDINRFAMRFFRDVARSKARKRLYGNQHALIPMLFNMETPYEDLVKEQDLHKQDALYLTLEELEYFTGEDEEDEQEPILYLSIDGKIFDVSAGSNFYGVGGKYHLFVGKDATRAFATGCLEDTPECTSSSKQGLSEKELREIQKWVELYDTHDRYKFVGYLVQEDPIDVILEKEQGET